jgi:hypothetical protein
MNKTNRYYLTDVDIHNTEKIRSYLSFIKKRYPNSKIKVFNENNGFSDETSETELNKQIDEYAGGDTGLDEINLLDDKRTVLSIVMHEKWLLLEVTENEKMQFEREFKETLKKFPYG